ncbi:MULTISPECIES: hypothetical protein [Marinomonas]|uniref:VanZ family protein n=1 Tax=Marinomonas arctica TaxID=383750 RepID=A0A7H1J2F0_9GAMM|nr:MULTISPECIES: hypothetical protein [Marinomonas]MCS7487812.1 hypothetical protein [Marinomonas sp. BSi20414]QNT04666.1 hypothetical protein IBG28_13195 [Marinomonas arctica]GGN32485.1 hypothetical protein GCM10011350_27000 [Marinomonas arctica]
MTKSFYVTWLTSPTAQAVGFLLGALIISVSTLTPAEFLPPAPGSDKIHHLLGFGGWTLLCAFGPIRRFAYMALSIVLWGGMIELIQPYINRHGEWFDFYANSSGVIFIVFSKLLLERFFKHPI